MKNTTATKVTATPVVATSGLVNKPLRIFVVNYAGGAGKTTLTRHLIAPSFAVAPVVLSIESLNSTGASGATKQVKAKDFLEVVGLMLRNTTPTIVDVGASSIEKVRDALRTLGKFHEKVDMFVVPTSPDVRQISDTLNTLKDLLEMGVSPSKIHVLKNKVHDVDTMDADFASIGSFCSSLGMHLVDRPILELELYSQVFFDETAGSVGDIMADETDFEALIAQSHAAGDVAGEQSAAAAYIRRYASEGAVSNLAKVRAELFAGV